MNRVGRNSLVGGLVVIGSALLASPSAKEGIAQIFPGSVPATVWTLLPAIGFLFLVLAAVLWVVIRVPVPALMPNYEGYVAREGELKGVHELAERYLGSNVSHLNRMISWHRINPEIFKVIYRVTRTRWSKSKKMVGYYCIIPINGEAVEKLTRKEITGAEFQSEHIVSDGRTAEAVYIGAIVAAGMFAQGNTRSLLHSELTGQRSKRTCIAFTRPTTKHGMRLVREYRFTAVDPAEDGELDALYKKDLSA